MKHEKTSQLGFGDLQMQRRKVKSGFFNTAVRRNFTIK